MTTTNLLQLLLFKLKLARKIFYINGADTLPSPLCAADEQKYTRLLKEHDPKARNMLIEHNLRLVVYIAKKFENTGIGLEDLISIGTIGLIKAVGTFNVDKNIKLATYASRCIENEILMHLRKTNHTKSEISIEEPLNVDWDGNELLLADILSSDNEEIDKHLETEVDHALLASILKTLGRRERTIMELRFGLLDGKERTQKDVADLLGISQSYISRLEKKILSRLRIELELQDQIE